MKKLPAPALALALQAYLDEVLGLSAQGLRAWAGSKALPFYLTDAFHLYELSLQGQPVLLALQRPEHRVGLANAVQWVGQIRKAAGQPVLYVVPALASYERRRLIQQQLPFAVPRNQLYLPPLGVDLRERFLKKSAARPSANFSPSTQALLLAWLLNAGVDGSQAWQPGTTARQLGYSAMAGTRALQELEAAGLGAREAAGKAQCLRLAGSTAAQVWAQAGTLLRSPVMKTTWVRAARSQTRNWRLAGESALSRQTALAPPRWPVHALEHARWRELQDSLEWLPEPEPGAVELQIWRYSTALESTGDCVDPLSLVASLQDDPDERVQAALQQFTEQLKEQLDGARA